MNDQTNQINQNEIKGKLKTDFVDINDKGTLKSSGDREPNKTQ